MIEKVHEKGQDNVVIEDLVQDVAPKAASLVNTIIMCELLICWHIFEFHFAGSGYSSKRIGEESQEIFEGETKWLLIYFSL